MQSGRTLEQISEDIDKLLVKRKALAQDITETSNHMKFLNKNLSSLDLAINTLYQERAGQMKLF